jgi:GxxExxY protein
MPQQKTRPYQLCDIVRETAFAIHRYHGPGHSKSIYANALVHRLKKLGVEVEPQIALKVFDEDGTLLGDLVADAVVESVLVLGLHAVPATTPEHVAQLLGSLKASRIEHGALINFGASVFELKMHTMLGTNGAGTRSTRRWTAE